MEHSRFIIQRYGAWKAATTLLDFIDLCQVYFVGFLCIIFFNRQCRKIGEKPELI
jgi:hypothetical protein